MHDVPLHIGVTTGHWETRAKSAESRVDELRADNADLQERVDRQLRTMSRITADRNLERARADRLEEALRDLTRFAENMPGYSVHPYTAKARNIIA